MQNCSSWLGESKWKKFLTCAHFCARYIVVKMWKIMKNRDFSWFWARIFEISARPARAEVRARQKFFQKWILWIMEMTFAPSFVKLSQKLVFKSQKELSLRIWPYTRRQCGNKYDFVPASWKKFICIQFDYLPVFDKIDFWK